MNKRKKRAEPKPKGVRDHPAKDPGYLYHLTVMEHGYRVPFLSAQGFAWVAFEGRDLHKRGMKPRIACGHAEDVRCDHCDDALVLNELWEKGPAAVIAAIDEKHAREKSRPYAVKRNGGITE